MKTRVSRKSALVSALVEMGFKRETIEVSDTKMNLKGYTGDQRSQQANIRLKGAGWGYGQNVVGGSSNDLGFELQSDGTYTFHVSEYDTGKYNKNWQNRFLDAYAKCVVREVAAEQSWIIEEESQEGQELVIHLHSPY